MSKVKIAVSVVLLVSATSTFAVAGAFEKSEVSYAKRIYIRGDVGQSVSTFKDLSKDKKATIFGLGIGYNFSDYFRGEIDGRVSTETDLGDDLVLKSQPSAFLSFLNPTIRPVSVKATTYSFFANVYLDGSNRTIFTPYITAGVGFVNNRLAISFKDARGGKQDSISSRVAANLGAGMRVELIKNIQADFGYRYVITADEESNNTKDTPLKSINLPKYTDHELTAGLAYYF